MRFSLGHFQNVNQSFSDVFKHRHVLPQVEALKHHTKTRPQPNDLIHVGRDRTPRAANSHPDSFPLNRDGTAVGRLEQIDAAQKGAFARSGGAKHGDHVPDMGIQMNPFQHLDLTKTLVQVMYL